MERHGVKESFSENEEDCQYDEESDDTSKEKLFVVYSQDVLQEDLKQMEPLSGMEYNNELYFILQHSQIIRADVDASVCSVCSVGIHYCGYKLCNNPLGEEIDFNRITLRGQPVVFLPKLIWGENSSVPDLECQGYAVHRYDWKWRSANQTFTYVRFPMDE